MTPFSITMAVVFMVLVLAITIIILIRFASIIRAFDSLIIKLINSNHSITENQKHVLNRYINTFNALNVERTEITNSLNQIINLINQQEKKIQDISSKLVKLNDTTKTLAGNKNANIPRSNNPVRATAPKTATK